MSQPVNAKKVSELYSLSKTLRKPANFTKDEVLKMYKMLLNLGMFKTVMNSMNKFYKDIFFENYVGLIVDNPFYIDDKEEKGFIEKQYEGIKSQEEIVGNEIFLANRLTKISSEIIDIPRKNNGKNDMQKNAVSRLKWGKDKTKVMVELFNQYLSTLSNKDWNFMDNVEFDNNGDLDENFYKKVTRDANAKIDMDKYNEFKEWFEASLENILSKYPKWKAPDCSAKDIPNFHMFSRLIDTQTTFYRIKSEGIKKAIDLSKSEKISVYNASQYDQKNSDKVSLIHIELPGYNAPILVHCLTQEFQNNYGIDLKNDIRPLIEGYKGYPYMYFRLDDEQIKYIESISSHAGHDKYNRMIEYLKESIYRKNKVERMAERLKKREELEKLIGKNDTKAIKKSDTKNNEVNKEEGNKRGLNMDNSEKKANLGNQVDYKDKNGNYIADDEFINKFIVGVLEDNTSIQFPEKYKNALVQKKNPNKFGYVYSTIEKYMKETLKGKGDVRVESAKMFTYMKLAQRAFWSGVNGKKDRNKLYQDIYSEYERGFNAIVDGVKDNIDPSDLKKYVNSKIQNIKIKGPSKLPAKMTKNKTVNDGLNLEEKIAKAEEVLKTGEINIDSDETKKDLTTQNSKNEKISRILIEQNKKISYQKELIQSKEEYISLLNELKQKEQIIKDNQDKINKQDETITKLESELFIDRGEK